MRLRNFAMISFAGRTASVAVFAALFILTVTHLARAEAPSGWIAPETGPAVSSASEPVRSEAGVADPISPADILRSLVHEYATLTGIPAELAHAVVTIESRYNPTARNGPHYGLMQINVATARSMGFSGEASELLEPATNLRFGMAYLAGAYKLAGGDTCGTIMRYQGGHRATRMSAASAKYCARAKTIAATMR